MRSMSGFHGQFPYLDCRSTGHWGCPSVMQFIYTMGKPLSRPGCLRQSPCCSKKTDREGYNEDGYIPQRSIYDTMCINEQIDHGSAHSTLGSRIGRDTDFSSNGSLGGDMFDTRSSVLISSGRRLDERFIFDSLKLANDELRSPGGFVRSASPSVSCSSAPGGSMNKRHPLQDSKKDNLCRHSWKVLTPPKFPDALELSPGEKNYLNPGVAFFPNSITSPQISPFSGSPFSTGTHTPSVFFSPSPLPYHQQFHRQSLPTQPTSPRPPLSELSVSALMCGDETQREREKEQENRGNVSLVKERVFETFKPKPIEPVSEQQRATPEPPENDTTPLLHSQVLKSPVVCTTSMESTWPRRLIGRRRTVRQGGAVHNLPILPPLPSLLLRSVSDKKPMPRLSPFPEHQGKVEGQLGKSMLKSELKECSLQDWKILRDIEERKSGSFKTEMLKEKVIEGSSQMAPVQEKAEESDDENTPSECEVENWEAVLEMVNSLWDETWRDSDSQNLGSLRRWPLLHPPTGFGGSQAPSATSSELGAEDLLELERISRQDSLDSELIDLLPYQSVTQLKENKYDVVITQPTRQNLDKPMIPTILSFDTAETELGNKYGQTGSPDSNLTLDSDSSGVYMSNPSQTSKEDITSDGDRSMLELDLGRVASPNVGANEQGICTVTVTSPPEINDSKHSTLDKKQPPLLRAESKDRSQEIHTKKKKTKGTVMQEGSKCLDNEFLDQEIHNTVNTSKIDVPLPLSPSKHNVKGTLLDITDVDPFVATDSFVYLAVSVMPPPPKEKASSPAQEDPSPPAPLAKPCPYPDECDFLSTDSFVYLAAPDCHLLVAEGHSVYGDSKDSDSEDSGSRADFVLASTVGDSDWDSDLSDSDPEPVPAKHAWDHWVELEQDVLQRLFNEDQSETGRECHGDQAEQISCQCGEVAAIVVQERAEVSSQQTQGGEPHTEVKAVS
ncbi:hypothetical protein P4O66_011531 [Electrophorus voltai]|uniref:Uncharacterized protein n=1 Tax=Electrophorus voltai TaxID=2609070 RepID=A0AAD9DT84_9TELE|nr:hypothetical protein P4O66_011531 [Electrophorus voltai]